MRSRPVIQEHALPRLPLRDYTRICWWCEATANSREHRHKASDLRREFSRNEYAKREVIIARGREPNITVRGPGAKVVKWEASLCARCNNERSQPFDTAYDQLVQWFLENEREVEVTGLIRLSEIYDDYEVGAAHAAAYFVKHIGCRIADYGFQVPQSLRDFLDGHGHAGGLVVSFEMNLEFVGVHARMRLNPEHGAGFLGYGPLTARISRDHQFADEFHGWWSYHGLQVVWEWNRRHLSTWTNLVGPTAKLPLTNRAAGRALLRTATPGLLGTSWRTWYRLRRFLWHAPDRTHDTDGYVDLARWD